MRILPVILLILPQWALAAGSEDDTPPDPSPTTQECPEGQVYQPDTETCVDIEESDLEPEAQIQTVRELAYAGRLQDAQNMLDQISDQGDDMVLTYRGFTARKLDQIEAARDWYGKALATNPDNLLARSYMGQGYVETGDIDLAQLQLAEIRARGGAGSWAETSLVNALNSGESYSY